MNPLPSKAYAGAHAHTKKKDCEVRGQAAQLEWAASKELWFSIVSETLQQGERPHIYFLEQDRCGRLEEVAIAYVCFMCFWMCVSQCVYVCVLMRQTPPLK